MPPPEHGADDSEELLNKLRETPMASLRKGVAKVEGLSEQDEEGHKRWIRSQIKRTKQKLHSWFLHFLFFVICAVVIILAIGGIYLAWVWVNSFIDDAQKIGDFLSKIWNIGLVALATLFIQSVLPKD